MYIVYIIHMILPYYTVPLYLSHLDLFCPLFLLASSSVMHSEDPPAGEVGGDAVGFASAMKLEWLNWLNWLNLE